MASITMRKEFRELVREHIKDIISDNAETLEMQLQRVVDEFKNWYHPYYRKQYPNRQEAFIQFTLALPGQFSAEHTYHNIDLVMKYWFDTVGGKGTYKEPKSLEAMDYQYRYLLYRELLVLFKQNGIEWL